MQRLRSHFIVLLLALFSLPSSACALSGSEIERLLGWFDRDPQAFMARDPSTHEPTTEPIAEPTDGPSDRQQLIDPVVLAAKNELRSKLLQTRGVEIQEANQEVLEGLLDMRELKETGGKILKDLRAMDARGFQKSKLTNEVWSGSGWSMYRGSTAQRYNIPSAHNSSSWQEAWAYVSTAGNTLFDIATRGGSSSVIDDLSPAEKYDLLIAPIGEQKSGSLSRYEWQQGAKRQRVEGKVGRWFGYCHGWAAASFMLARPTSSVTIPSADGRLSLKFYPSDIKALETVLWANNPPRIRIVGNRCNTSNPKRDPIGRVIDEACFDVNPGTFHLAVVNQVSSARRNLVMDSTYDIQIWNQPIISYSYKYFNPQTGKAAGYEQSLTRIEDYQKDKFAHYRSTKARKVIGVAMNVVYGLGANPNHNETDSIRSDRTKSVDYLYDLELDEKEEIIGGEWYQLRHPDFIWTLAADARAVSEPEKVDHAIVGRWIHGEPIPKSWRKPALDAAGLGQPLAVVVESLLRRSRGGLD